MKDIGTENKREKEVGSAGDTVVFGDGRYTFGKKDGTPYLTVGDRTYTLSCHPYEPCLYIRDESGATTAVHNSFDPLAVLGSFSEGGTVTSITGLEYTAKDFCKMIEYAAGSVDIQIDDAERVFGARAKRTEAKPGKKKEEQSSGESEIPPELFGIIEDDPFFELIAGYPDCVIDWCLVENAHIAAGCNAHWIALVSACRKLFFDGSELIWHYNAGKADAKQIGAGALLALSAENGSLNYRRAFLAPPYGTDYTDADFEKVNAALFPNGTDDLEVYEWTTDWSEYFDEGHEWWGALCFTVYDGTLDRFAVIMASATD